LPGLGVHRFFIGGKMKILLCGHEIQIDAEEIWRLSKYKYHKRIRNNRSKDKIYFQRWNKNETYTLSREIMNTPKVLECDHIDGDTLNLLKENMRNCTHAENVLNQKKRKDNKSGFKGVDWSEYHKKWRAQIAIKYKRYHLGYYKTAIEAHAIYCEAAIKYHGEYAHF
jgi:hypothetical protein